MITYSEFCDVAEMYTKNRVPFKDISLVPHSRKYRTSYTWTPVGSGKGIKFHIPEISDDGSFQFSFVYKGSVMIGHNDNIKKDDLISKVKEMILRRDFETL